MPGVPGSPGEPLTVAAPAGFDWAMTGLGAALVVGAVIDGWAHNHDPGLETFFTPWHALLYSALLVNGVVLGLRWLAARTGQPVQGPVEVAVAAAVEAMSGSLAAAGFKRGDAGESGECGFVTDPAAVGPADEQLGGGDRADAGLG